MDYRYIREQLMKSFHQLVAFEIREVSQNVCGRNKVVYDLATKHKGEKVYYSGSYNNECVSVILPKLSSGDEYQDHLVRTFNLYNAIVRKEKNMISYGKMEAMTKKLCDSDKQIHWVWFREKDYYLPDKIMSRAKSWINLNPEFNFYLWTDLQDEKELSDFTSKLLEENRQYFTNNTIVVKYKKDVDECIDNFLKLHKNELDSDTESILKYIFKIQSNDDSQITKNKNLDELLSSNVNDYKCNRIFRTDILRAIVLSLFGGIYSDFNDTICFVPIKYLLSLYVGKYFAGCDRSIEASESRNNYFLYSSLNNLEFINKTIKVVNNATKLYQVIMAPSYMERYTRVIHEFLARISEQNTDFQEHLALELIRLPEFKNLSEGEIVNSVIKDVNIIAEVFCYLGTKLEICKIISERLTQEIQNKSVISRIVGEKNTMCRMRQRRLPAIVLPIEYDKSLSENVCDTYEFRDQLLLKFMKHSLFTIMDKTNIAFIEEFKYLVPYSYFSKLSNISMITHIYDASSFGVTKTYSDVNNDTNDLRNNILF
jgi:mannosyltransferase OCH1-like enzyme